MSHYVLKGNSIASGFNQELDELRNLATSGKDYLDKMLERETEQTGITSLKTPKDFLILS